MVSKIILFLFLLLSLQGIAQSNEAKVAYNNAVKAFNVKDFNQGVLLLEEVVSESPDFLQAQRLIAECYKGLGDEKGTQKHYKLVLNLQERQPDLWYSLGLSYVREKNTSEAKTAFENVLKFNPNHTKAKRQLSYLGSAGSAESIANTTTTKGVKESKPTITPTNKTDSNLAMKYANKGVGYYNEKQFKEAILAFDKALELKPSAKLYSYAGRSRMHEKKVDEAIELLKKAIAHDSDNGEYHYYLSKAYELKGIDNLTEKYFNMAKKRGFAGTAEVFNSKAVKNYNQGIDFLQTKRYADAIVAFQRAIAEDSNKAKYYYSLALAYMETKRLKEAKEILEQGLEVDPGYGSNYKLMGDYYYANKKYAKAGSYYENAITYGNDSYNDYMNLGYAYSKIGNFKKALDNFLIAEQKAPHHIEIRFTVATTYFKANEFASAEKKFLSILDDEPNHIKSLFNISAIYDRMGEYDKGLVFAHRLIDLEPTNGEAYHQAGVLYGHKGDWKNKDKYYRKAASLGYNHDPLNN